VKINEKRGRDVRIHFRKWDHDGGASRKKSPRDLRKRGESRKN